MGRLVGVWTPGDDVVEQIGCFGGWSWRGKGLVDVGMICTGWRCLHLGGGWEGLGSSFFVGMGL